MEALVHRLCSDECAGRAPGTRESRAARSAIVDELRAIGLDPCEQPVPACRGANVIASLRGDVDRWIVVGAHYDHLGRVGQRVYWGADDNAAALGVLVDVGRRLAVDRPRGRGVLLAAFDGEEPPYFGTDGMGSVAFVKKPPVPLDRIDLMVCMDLVGHALGGPAVPAPVRTTLFALGAERADATPGLVDAIATEVPGVTVRRADAEIIPPLSDYEPFWRRKVPFLFLTAGRSRVYHTPLDTPDRLDFDKMHATGEWLARFVRSACAHPAPFLFRERRDDASTLASLVAMLRPLEELSPMARAGRLEAEALRTSCDAQGVLPARHREDAMRLVAALESALA